MRIPGLEIIKSEHFKIKFKSNSIFVSVDWPVAYKQAFSVGPFYQLIDSQTISVSRKAEQVIVTLGKKQRMKWDQLTANKEEFEQARLNPKTATGTPTKKKPAEPARQSVSPQSQAKLLSNFNKTGKLAPKLPANSRHEDSASVSKLTGSKEKPEAKARLHTEGYDSLSLEPENKETGRRRDEDSNSADELINEPGSARLAPKTKHKVMFIDTDPKERNIAYQSQDADWNLKESKDGFPIKKLVSGNKQVFSERKANGRGYGTETDAKGKGGLEKASSRSHRGEKDETARQSYTADERSERKKEGEGSQRKTGEKTGLTSLRLSQVTTKSSAGIEAKQSGTQRNQTPKKGETPRNKMSLSISGKQLSSKKNTTVSGTPGHH